MSRSPRDHPHRAHPRLLVVVGLRREAAILGETAARVAIGARDLAEAAAEAGAVISFGLAGGLTHTLGVGDLVIGEGGGCDAAWVEALARALPNARRGRVVGSDRPVGAVAEKARLGAMTGALAVDMESHEAAAAARRARRPFAILRALSDPLERELPSTALAGFASDGRANLGAVVRALLRRPAELPALIGVARDASRAFRSLRYARDLLGPGLGCPYLGQHLLDVS